MYMQQLSYGGRPHDDESNPMQDAGGVPPDYQAIAATELVVPANYDPTNETLWFAWGPSDGSFATREEATAAFHTFLAGVTFLSTSCMHVSSCV